MEECAASRNEHFDRLYEGVARGRGHDGGWGRRVSQCTAPEDTVASEFMRFVKQQQQLKENKKIWRKNMQQLCALYSPNPLPSPPEYPA